MLLNVDITYDTLKFYGNQSWHGRDDRRRIGCQFLGLVSHIEQRDMVLSTLGLCTGYVR